MNPEQVIQLALAGIQIFTQLIAKVQAAHNMNDLQLEAFVNQTDDQTRAMVTKFLAQIKADINPAPVVKVPIPAGDSGVVLQSEFDKARANEAAGGSTPDASTGAE